MPQRGKLIDPLWQPAPADRDYASDLGLNVDREADDFLDRNLARGERYVDWSAAWRTWCRRAVEYGRSSGQRSMPLLAVVDGQRVDEAADPYGARCWARNLPEVDAGRFDGELRPAVCGFDVAGVACDLCEAAGYRPNWRGDLSVVPEWLRGGVDPDDAVREIRRVRRPGVSLRWYDDMVRGRRRQSLA